LLGGETTLWDITKGKSSDLDLIKQVEQAPAEMAPGKRAAKTAKLSRFAATKVA
jgi:hypothetical protein